MIHRFLANRWLGELGSGYPPHLYVALLRNLPQFGDTGSTIIEPSAESYERLEIVNDQNNFSVPVNGLTTNIQSFDFPDITEDWGLIRGWALCDALVDGELYISFRSPQIFAQEGSSVLIPTGSMSVRVKNA